MTVVLSVLLLAVRTRREAPALSERQVKALFLFNFAKYVDWPADAFSNSTRRIVIGVVGEDGFSDEFKRVTGDRTVNGRKVVIKQVEDTADLKECQILFISSSEKGASARHPGRGEEFRGVDGRRDGPVSRAWMG